MTGLLVVLVMASIVLLRCELTPSVCEAPAVRLSVKAVSLLSAVWVLVRRCLPELHRYSAVVERVLARGINRLGWLNGR